MRRALIALATLLGCWLGSAAPAAAQCSGVVPANKICAGPTTGADSFPSWRSSVLADLPAGTNGQALLGVTGSPPNWATFSQDCTITNAGVVTCTKTNNVAFAASATTDTTNASNISSGTLSLTLLALANTSIYVGNASNNPAAVALSRDCTITNAGAITCTKTNNVSFTALATAAVGQLPGTATNDNAASGDVGEFLSSDIVLGSAVSLVNATAKNVTSLSLTAGDWDCTGGVVFSGTGSTTVTSLAAWISTTSNTIPATSDIDSYIQSGLLAGTAGISLPILPLVPMRFSFSTTTTVFMGTQASFGASTLAAYGTFRCRRMR